MLTCAETCFRHSLQCMRLHVGMSPWSQIPWTLLLYNVLVFKPQAASAGLLCFVMLLLKLTLTCSVVVAIYLAQTEILACKAAAAQRLAHVLLPAAPSYTLCVSPTWCGFNSVSTWLVWCGTIFKHKIQKESVIAFILTHLYLYLSIIQPYFSVSHSCLGRWVSSVDGEVLTSLSPTTFSSSSSLHQDLLLAISTLL